MATEQLRWLFAVLLTVTPLDSSPFIHTLTISLSRLSLFSNAITIPPLLIGMGESTVTERMLDKSLNDSDILIEYMQRINSMGWSSKSHFEERWMQLLGVLNTAPPHEGWSLVHVHVQCTCICYDTNFTYTCTHCYNEVISIIIMSLVHVHAHVFVTCMIQIYTCT